MYNKCSHLLLLLLKILRKLQTHPAIKLLCDVGVELLQFVVSETQKFYTDLSAKIGAAIETGHIPAAPAAATAPGFLQQLTMPPQYIAFAPQPQVTQPSQPIIQQPILHPVQPVSALVSRADSQAGKKIKRKLSAFNVYMQKVRATPTMRLVLELCFMSHDHCLGRLIHHVLF